MGKIDNSEMWKVGKKLQDSNYENFINKTRINLSSTVHLENDYYYMYHINPKTAGLYIGGMMAQIDILLENDHSVTEIINESISFQ